LPTFSHRWNVGLLGLANVFVPPGSAAMEQRSPDPFFDQLRADIQEGLDEADRGELIDEAEVWKHLDAVIDEVEQKSRRL
jgi:hypothetical protein